MFAENEPVARRVLPQHQVESDAFFARAEVKATGGDDVADAVLHFAWLECHGGIARWRAAVAQLAEKSEILRIIEAGKRAIFLTDEDLQVGCV